MRNGASRLAIQLAVMLALTSGLAHAQQVQATQTTSGVSAVPSTSGQPSVFSSITALAEFKKAQFDLGYTLQVNYTGEVFGNPTGGVKRRGIYDQLIETALDGDLNKIVGLNGASFHVNFYVINGLGLSTCCVFNVLSVSSIEARATTRLYEAWFEQKLFGDLASIRIGQLGADTEFFLSDFGALYINAAFGWPNILAADLPSTGPNYPLATPAVRLKVTPNDQITFLAAIFNGDPSGARFRGTQEILDPAGINFRLEDPPFIIAEAQYRYNQTIDSPNLAGTIRLGGWHQFGKIFPDQRYDNNGFSLTGPWSNGVPMLHFGGYGIYGIVDQILWRLPGDDPKKGIGAFARVSIIPSDKNQANFYADGGVNFIGLWNSRPNDTFGLAVAYSPISASLRGHDADANIFTNTALPIRDYEMALEFTYLVALVPGWNLQPDFQYIFHPNYGAIDPINPAIGRIRDAAVFGLRTAVKF